MARRILALIAVVAGGESPRAQRRRGREVTLRTASACGPQHQHNEALRWYAERVAKRTSGGLDLKVLDGSQLACHALPSPVGSAKACCELPGSLRGTDVPLAPERAPLTPGRMGGVASPEEQAPFANSYLAPHGGGRFLRRPQ